MLDQFRLRNVGPDVVKTTLVVSTRFPFKYPLIVTPSPLDHAAVMYRLLRVKAETLEKDAEEPKPSNPTFGPLIVPV